MIIGQWPREGDTRTRKVFAWLPAWCSDGTVRWLERIEITEQYSSGLYPLHASWERTNQRAASTA